MKKYRIITLLYTIASVILLSPVIASADEISPFSPVRIIEFLEIAISLTMFLGVGAIIAVMIVKGNKQDKDKKGQSKNQVSSLVPSDFSFEIQREMQKREPGFSSRSFSSDAVNTFVKVLTCASQGDTGYLKKVETDRMFQRHCDSIDSFRSRGLANKYSDINITTSYPDLYTRKSGKEYIRVYLSGTFRNYTVKLGEENSGARYFEPELPIKYLITFERPLTDDVPRTESGFCPNCGAPVTDSSRRICPYCLTELGSVSGNEWKLCDIYMMRDDSPIDDIGITG